jgi:hypothetical protein
MNMNHTASPKTFIRQLNVLIVLCAIFVVFPINLFAQDEGADSEGGSTNEFNTSDTLRFSKYRVIVDLTKTLEHYTGTRMGLSEDLTIHIYTSTDEEQQIGTIGFSNHSIAFEEPESDLEGITVRIRNKNLCLFYNDTTGKPLIEFSLQGDALAFSAKMVSEFEHSFDAPNDSIKRFDDRYFLLSQIDFPDTHPLKILELIKSKKLMAAGEWDLADSTVQALADTGSSPADTYVLLRCKKLLSDIAQYRQKTVPFDLANAGKIGIVLDAPIYPPGDTPTVFWQDSLLCVIQSKDKMRTYDPLRKQWGKITPAKYPRCSVKGFYQIWGCQYCEKSPIFWHTSLGLPAEEGSCDLCDCFTDTRPLVSLPSDSLFLFKGGYR